jgi:hypothetical protein
MEENHEGRGIRVWMKQKSWRREKGFVGRGG